MNGPKKHALAGSSTLGRSCRRRRLLRGARLTATWHERPGCGTPFPRPRLWPGCLHTARSYGKHGAPSPRAADILLAFLFIIYIMTLTILLLDSSLTQKAVREKHQPPSAGPRAQTQAAPLPPEPTGEQAGSEHPGGRRDATRTQSLLVQCTPQMPAEARTAHGHAGAPLRAPQERPEPPWLPGCPPAGPSTRSWANEGPGQHFHTCPRCSFKFLLKYKRTKIETTGTRSPKGRAECMAEEVRAHGRPASCSSQRKPRTLTGKDVSPNRAGGGATSLRGV